MGTPENRQSPLPFRYTLTPHRAIMGEDPRAHQPPQATQRGFFHRLGIRTKLTVFFYLITFISLATIGSYGYSHANRLYLGYAIEASTNLTHAAYEQIQWRLATGAADTQFITHLYALLHYAYWQNIGDKDQITYWSDITSDILRNYAETDDEIFRIRFLDNQGHEQLVTQRDAVTGKARALSLNELQDLSEQKFFREIANLERGSVSISPIAPNIDQGEITKPILPVVNIASALFGNNGVRYGTVVVTRLSDNLLDSLRKANQNTTGRVIYLIDEHGEYLFHPDPDRAFGQLLGHGTSFWRDFPTEFKQIGIRPKGWIREEQQILTFQTIVPAHAQDGNSWTIVSVTPQDRILSEMHNFILGFLAIATLVATGMMIAARYLIAQVMRPLLFVTNQLEQLERGEAIPQTLDYTARDEITRMLESTHRVVENLQHLTKQTDAIASGNLDSEVQPASESDRLGISIQHMTAMLRANHLANQKNNWQKDGLAELTQALTGDLDPPHLADIALSQVGRYLGAGRGVLYVSDSTSEALELIGSFMYTERTTLGARIRLGEGAVGQVAREKRPIVLHIGPVGATTPPPTITTGSVHIPAHYTYTWPLLHENTLHGVLEVATANRLEEHQVQYLSAAADTIASFFLVAVQHKRIQDLLTTSDTLTKEAQEQSQRLQEANQQMKDQQWRLQNQAEELQQSNSQMEEQQQQLQQQSEELRQANAQLEEQQRQLSQQATDLESRNRVLEQASRYKSDFLANMSHELRTPLNSIILLSKILTLNDHQHLDSEELKRAEVIHQAGGELLRLIDDILDLSKIESGRMEIHTQLVASTDLIVDFQRQFEDTATAKGLAFLCEDRLNGAFTTDRDRVSQIIRNLLSNAFKFTRTGRITLSIAHKEDSNHSVTIAVTDTGIGIPREQIGYIFDTFRQADASISREFGGTGLGLSISLRLAQLLGGTLTVESTLGVGSTFTLQLPATLANRSVAPPTPPAQQPSTTPPDDREHLLPGEEAILLIDDDPAFRSALIHLNHQQGFKTLVATSAAEGLSLARTYRPSGILLDLGLPDMDGTELLKILKSDRSVRSVPVYIVSARDRDPALLQQNVIGYLRKPLNDKQIVFAEHELLQHVATTPRLLVVEGAGVTAAWVQQLLPNAALEIYALPEGSEDIQPPFPANQTPCGLALIGLGASNHLKRCESVCDHLRRRFPDMHLLIYSQRAISDEEDSALRRYTDTIVVHTQQAERRLLENIEHFLREVRTNSNSDPRITPTPSRENRLRGKRVLVVDDDPRNLFVVTSALEREGALVKNALDGRKAIEFLLSRKKAEKTSERPVDIIFMDIMMPNMNGYEAIATIKADPDLRTIPIVALTAKAMKADRTETVTAGADDYLAKPVDYEILINMAEIWCDRQIA